MAFYKITVKFNLNNLGQGINIYFARNVVGTPSDTQVRSDATNYMEAIYGPLRGHMDSGVSFMNGQVDEVDAAGVVLRLIGSITPTIGGQAAAEALPHPTAASVFVRTAEAKVRGSKRWAGFAENRQADGLWDNTMMNILSAAALAYIGDFGSPLSFLYRPGVISTKTGGFVDFGNVATLTNIPGTQVTRKPGRGV